MRSTTKTKGKGTRDLLNRTSRIISEKLPNIIRTSASVSPRIASTTSVSEGSAGMFIPLFAWSTKSCLSRTNMGSAWFASTNRMASAIDSNRTNPTPLDKPASVVPKDTPISPRSHYLKVKHTQFDILNVAKLWERFLELFGGHVVREVCKKTRSWRCRRILWWWVYSFFVKCWCCGELSYTRGYCESRWLGEAQATRRTRVYLRQPKEARANEQRPGEHGEEGGTKESTPKIVAPLRVTPASQGRLH